MKLLLHACCAPCSIECVETLKGEEIIPDLYYYNPNIHPFTEFRARRDALSAYAEHEGLTLAVGEYGLRDFLKAIEGEDRCSACYRMRMRETARRAKDAGYSAFSTTLLISPYQNHEVLIEVCEACAREAGVEFLYRDFRPHFRPGQAAARARGIYMQKYCGCIFSEEERYAKK